MLLGAFLGGVTCCFICSVSIRKSWYQKRVSTAFVGGSHGSENYYSSSNERPNLRISPSKEGHQGSSQGCILRQMSLIILIDSSEVCSPSYICPHLQYCAAQTLLLTNNMVEWEMIQSSGTGVIKGTGKCSGKKRWGLFSLEKISEEGCYRGLQNEEWHGRYRSTACWLFLTTV